MAFIAHTQEELKSFNIEAGKTYSIEYSNKDYYNGEETIEKGKDVAFVSDGSIHFTVTDPHGMDKLTMKARFLG